MTTDLLEGMGLLFVGAVLVVAVIVGPYAVWNRLVTRRIRKLPDLKVVKDDRPS